ncbi:cytochrome c oxidase assembly protein [Neobacillus sp. MER 74]|uniref:cytochrome c oxidase assembly protein n=1 Tax=Neobacillus sp. MER 74 TaxID=2939566 RepID=UPI00203D8890|nr:cytochrome c oxidase assembly protein [Neobacillus sp. MER 74]MCM3115279.1 cytochrome c oxidase assembly protein [Neobacillus sp. MER 74]
MFYAMWLEGQLLWNMPLLACLICLTAIYVYVTASNTNIKFYQKQPLLYFLSLGIMYLTFGSPFETISHLSFSLHMLQMSILYFIISPLFVLGIPDALIQSLREHSLTKRVSKYVLPSKAALYTFGAMFLMYHFPIVLTSLAQTSIVHNGYLFVLLLLSFRMWQPITVPDPKKEHSHEQNKRYLFLSGLVIMPACLLFIITAFIGGMNNPLLSELTANLCISPSQLSQLSSLDILPSTFNTRLDQMFAGILMLGMHKFGVVLTVRLGRKTKSGAVAGGVD